MILAQVKFTYKLKNRGIPTSEEVEQLIPTIDRLYYPIGIIPTYIFNQTDVYDNYTITENYNYFLNVVTTTLGSYYTTEQLKICALYVLLCLYKNDFYTTDEIAALTNPYLDQHSSDIGIEFCLNELRYKRLKMALHEPDADNEFIEGLIEVLDPIEEAHNQIIISKFQDQP